MDKYSKLMGDLELLYNKWAREWAKMVMEDTQPTRETIRVHLLELRGIIEDNIDYTKIQELIDYACE